MCGTMTGSLYRPNPNILKRAKITIQKNQELNFDKALV